MVKKRILAKFSILAYAEPYFLEKNKYSAEKCQSCPTFTVIHFIVTILFKSLRTYE